MKKIHKLFVTSILVTPLVLLGGCQNLQALNSANNQKVFKAPSYLGKELPSTFLSNEYAKTIDNGHKFRGYDLGKRHWRF